jgi:ketosteroid isomerase-like protein
MEPQAVARRYYDLVDAGNNEELVTLFTEDVLYERPGQDPIEGREALRQFYEEERPLSAGEHELHSVVADGETVAVRGTFRGEQAGERVDIGFADFHEFEDGKIGRRYTFTDRDTV